MIDAAMPLPPTSTSPALRETQRFFDNRVFRWALGGVLLLGVTSLAIAMHSGAGGEALGALGGALLVTLLVGRMGLVTEVTGGQLRVRLWPFPSKTYALADIESAEVRAYRPIREYGGWGLRFGPSGMAWNAYGDRGVQLVLRSGRRVLIGSQDAEALARAIQARLGR